jgi:hypothetical protein
VENQEAYQKAKKRVEAKIGFYIHLAVYAAVNILLKPVPLVQVATYGMGYCRIVPWVGSLLPFWRIGDQRTDDSKRDEERSE